MERKISRIISMNVDLTDPRQTLSRIERLVKIKKGAYVCVSNVHMCIETMRCNDFQSIVNNADFVIPDGKPLSWAQNLLGHTGSEQVRGQDIMNGICAASGEQLVNIGLYGGSSAALLAVVNDVLLTSHPNIKITYTFSPPFRPLTEVEDEGVVAAINQAKVNVLFVGMGCPKQERWMAAHKDKLSCVMLGVGAAYDFIAGSKKEAPRWIQRIGMEWLFRLYCEPKRLWRRYLYTNPLFIWHFGKQLIKHKLG
jgi:N-acetylglucosaminyldiphosphoundecaprenol N-acetyl-beta-D-mannosaminyltransferase